jgi:hypothetical protein
MFLTKMNKWKDLSPMNIFHYRKSTRTCFRIKYLKLMPPSIYNENRIILLFQINENCMQVFLCPPILSIKLRFS